jgi:lysophospholipase L1-like esterase
MHAAVEGKPARRVLRAIVVSVVTTGLLAVASAPALAKKAAANRKHPTITAHTAINEGSSYLALGDSVTFGYEESQVVPAPNYQDASSFIGYPEQFGAELHVRVVNAACPGETSASLIDATAQSNGCENSPGGGNVGYRTLFPLHVSYSGSQLDFAVGYLRTHHDVRLVSLMIGANDFFVCQETTADHCTSATELAATVASVSKNVAMILSAIRYRAHYGGQIAIVNYYSLDYSSAADNASSALLNQTQDNAAAPFHVEIADGFGELQAAALHSGGSTCNAGLLTQLVGASTPCGIHPSYAGQTLLAASLAKVVRVSGPFWPFW